MEIWSWNQSEDKKWKAVSDRDNGVILVYNERNELVLEREGLSREAVIMIEESFFKEMANNLKEENPEVTDNPMYT